MLYHAKRVTALQHQQSLKQEVAFVSLLFLSSHETLAYSTVAHYNGSDILRTGCRIPTEREQNAV